MKTVTEAIESLERNNTITPSSTSSSAPPQLETNTKLFTIRVISRLYGMRGWLNSFNLDDLKKSFVLDPTNLLSLFHICQAQQRLLAGSRRGDVALATETIESLYKFILLSLDSSSMSSSGGDLEFVLSSALAFKPKVDPGFIMALYALLDIMFRKGPRGGITFEQLLEGVERVFNVAEELKNNLIGSTTTGYSLKESEVKMLEISSERALKTLDGLKEMAKKNNR